jgi:hypothetical protein
VVTQRSFGEPSPRIGRGHTKGEPVGRLDDLRWHFGCGAASGASIGRESPVAFGNEMRNPIRRFAVVILVLMSGCVSSRHVQRDALHPNRYREGAIYVLKRPVHGCVFDPLPGAPMRFNTVELINDENWPAESKVYGKFVDVPLGVEILLQDDLEVWTWETGTRDLINAKFLSGPYKGATVDLRSLSKAEPIDDPEKPWIFVCDPDYLEEKSPNQPPLRMPVSGTPAADAAVAPPPGIAGR